MLGQQRTTEHYQQFHHIFLHNATVEIIESRYRQGKY